MTKRDYKISLIIALCYWIPSTMVLSDIFNSTGHTYPNWVNIIFIPGYILGFFLGYAGKGTGALIGQIITLIILFLFVLGFRGAIKYRK